MASLGSGADIVSGGELFRALPSRHPPKQDCVCRGRQESRRKSPMPWTQTSCCSTWNRPRNSRPSTTWRGEKALRARVALRVQPGHRPPDPSLYHDRVEKRVNSVSGADRALEEFTTAAALPNVEVIGVHAHIGSQLTQVSPFVDSLKRVVGLIETLKSRGIPIRYLNIGGGLRSSRIRMKRRRFPRSTPKPSCRSCKRRSVKSSWNPVA